MATLYQEQVSTIHAQCATHTGKLIRASPCCSHKNEDQGQAYFHGSWALGGLEQDVM
jgi:hypothetical protein